MKRRWLVLAIALFFMVGIVSACGDKDDNNNNNNDNNNVENEDNNNDNDDNNNNEDNNDNNDNDDIAGNGLNNDDNDNNDNNDNDNNDNDDERASANASGNFDDLIEFMEDETEGEAELIYESDNGDEHDMDGFTVSLDEYALVELNDFHDNFSIPFDDQTDGGVLITKYTLKNDTDEDYSYMPMIPATYVGAEKNLDNYRDILPEDEQLAIMLTSDDDYTVKAGEEVTGYYTYPAGEDRLQDIIDAGEVEVEVPQPKEDNEDSSTAIGKEGKFIISLSDESADKNEDKASKGFYEDAVTADNMGDKEMLDEEEGIDETEELGDIKVTLDGYQFTEFEPNDDEAARFDSFENGIVLLTVKFDIENNSDDPIGKDSASSKLTMNDGSMYTLDEGMLLDYEFEEAIEPGDSDELLQVFLLDKRDYEDWEGRSYEVELGPIRDIDAQDISGGKKAEFDLK